MKKYLLIFSLLIFSFCQSQNIIVYRNIVKDARLEIKPSEWLIKNAPLDYAKNKKIEWKGFEAVGYFCMANLAMNPINKLKYFKKGKTIMDNAILEDPQNIELRFYRQVTQLKTPKMLGYNNLEEDKAIIKKNLSLCKDADLKYRIITYLHL